MENEEKYLAEQFILHTDRNIFLTGKAGTGKTTLLKEILDKTDKKAIVVAPTGVAAINAGGMTIHSTFQFPTTAFVPTDDFIDPELATNRSQLARKQKIRKERIELLLEVELLIIDEISMVRADLLDAIDYTLRRIRKNVRPFGGVQVLAIGDLFQLSPVVRENIWPVLAKYYSSPFFFDALAWKASHPITIELKKVYRQEDPVFVGILNRIRKGKATNDDITRLNENFHADYPKNVIHLTTHNRSANAINQAELEAIDAREILLEAKVSGKFPESSFPIPEAITLKKGCQVMFVRNNNTGAYFNGKIGTFLGMEGDEALVKGLDDNKTIFVGREEWKNTRYTVGEGKKVVTEDIGSFEQYPLKLAWAITVHKSQGLTFDEIAVDLKRTFAPGQLYVALSRCRSLDGLILTSKIQPHNVIVDRHIIQYYEKAVLDRGIHHTLQKAKKNYQDRQLILSFSISKLISYLDIWHDDFVDHDYSFTDKIIVCHRDITNSLLGLQETVVKFEKQLFRLIQTNDREQIKIRGLKAIIYFTDFLHEKVIKILDDHIKSSIKKSARYTKLVVAVRDEVWEKINNLYGLKYQDEKLHPSPPKHQKVTMFDPDEGSKKIKGETYIITLSMFREGKSIKEIADLRDYAVSTIESHMARLIRQEEVDISEVMKEKKANKIWKYLEANEEMSMSEVRTLMPFKVSFGEIRWVKAWKEE